MLLARPDARRKLGLAPGPASDPDVKAGRLIVADGFLESVLYGRDAESSTALSRFTGSDADRISKERTAWFIARDEYDQPTTLYEFPDGRRLRGDQITNWESLPAGTRVRLNETEAQERFEGFQILGGPNRSARDVAGDEYDAETTIYFLKDPYRNRRVWRGDELKAEGSNPTIFRAGR